MVKDNLPKDNLSNHKNPFLDQSFILGINYWPRESAMYWWKKFDQTLVKRDFSMLAEYNFKLIRIFLLWEDFQPEMKSVPAKTLSALVKIADIAYDFKMKILPTFFCGHMSGLNWVPYWIVASGREAGKYPLFSMGSVREGKIRNMYADGEVQKAQKLLIHETINALQGHKGIWGWDLGNEPSNLVLPPTKDAAKGWLEEMVTELKRYDDDLPITLGLHQEDLENNNLLTPKEVADYCEILSMHAYPGYADWSDGPLDEKFTLFLLKLTQWLGGKEVILEEFGLPTDPYPLKLSGEEKDKLGSIKLIAQTDAEFYFEKTLKLLPKWGINGALVWCFADYDPGLWEKPPLNERVHERFFGLFRWDGQPKSWAKVFQRMAMEKGAEIVNNEWLDIKPEEFYEQPGKHIKRLYQRFKKHLETN